jgi:hypothetical protein
MRALLLSILLLLPLMAAAQPAKATSDGESIESLVKAVYDVISGPAGHKRDWDRMRTLFLPDARMIAVGTTPAGEVRRRSSTVEEYITQQGPMLESQGFIESEVASRSERFGHIAHIFSTYEARRAQQDEKPFMRGINSFQLYHDGTRWWVQTIYWQSEDPRNPIPERYLKGG